MRSSHTAETGAGSEAAFTAFVYEAQSPIRRALVAGFGIDVGRDAAEEALVYAWQHWDRVSGMKNPRGYVYRVGHRMAQKMTRKENRPVVLPDVPAELNPVRVEPGLPAALSALSKRQRTVVVSVCGYGLSQADTARLLGITRSSVQRHLERGLTRLRSEMGVIIDA
ncbi:MAG: sigma-70 family RNA polymerase sigma factor [Actinomycetota bacterium]|nr:sigma-70 family RNA polymerase sigma factor [Actinomycetota bacterium]